ncbi:11579_t:CDS:2 [Acaulospora colombiana]|uniref:11579_t:CDS:1 n=1 Tax=Acaulospora colombiana TaxID=27376 RepID=A0ACA9JZS9_9GLOM|nr:11579_t:CDS:2 [Acaulospora colombiana]
MFYGTDFKGPIVIHDPNDPNKDMYDYEYVMTVADWYHKPTGDPSMLPTLRSENYFGFDPIPDSADISGVGQYKCTFPTCIPRKFATYKVKKGKRYRFRIINMSTMSHFWVSIDEHPLTIVEIDGVPTHPATIKMLPINIAQRYSVIVEANKEIGNYWIRTHLSNCSLPVNNVTINADSPIFSNNNITGILRYDDAPFTIPTSEEYHVNEFNCYDVASSLLKPYQEYPRVPQGENIRRIYIEVAIQRLNLVIDATMNNSSYVPDFTYPTNQRVIDGADFVTSDNVYSYNKLNEPIEILLNNTENRTHPFHLHGHVFWIIARGEAGSYNQPLSSLKYNFDDPPLRDTATVKELG